MSDVRIVSNLTSFIYDPQVFAYDTDIFWTTAAGTPAISGNNLRFNASAARTKGMYLYGSFVFNLTVPTAPTAGDARYWGLKGVAVGDNASVRFEISGTSLLAKIYDNEGTAVLSQLIPWHTDWTAAATNFIISFTESSVMFKVVGATTTEKFHIQISPDILALPLFVTISNTNADNLDMGYLSMLNVAHVESKAELSGAVSTSENIAKWGSVSVTAAAAPADATANTVGGGLVKSLSFGFNGTTWDRLRTAIASATATVTGLLNTLPLGKYNATEPTLTDGQVVNLQFNTKGHAKTINMATLVTSPYDYISDTWNAGTYTDTLVFKTGGSGGTTVATVAVVYTDATKDQLASVTKT